MLTDIAATEQIADMLLRAEEFWVQRQTDPSASPPSDESYSETNQDSSLPVKKLYVDACVYYFLGSCIMYVLSTVMKKQNTRL